ncbi:MAG: nuclear transport factor 2 family protein, partial [Gemmatimonadaceae bacterium]|nr:nuclear transport factor 2 family protein [Gemmatimonadaceae bacterium]
YHRECVEAFNTGDLSGFTETWAPDIAGHPVDQPVITGRARLAGMIADATPRAGVQVLLDKVIASREITVLEARLRNPTYAPDHCPTATTQVHFHPGGRTRSILFAFSEDELPRSADDQRLSRNASRRSFGRNRVGAAPRGSARPRARSFSFMSA